MHSLVVGDEVMNRISDHRSEKVVIHPVIAPGLRESQKVFHVLNARWIDKFLVLGQQELARDPPSRIPIGGEFPNRLGVNEKMETKLRCTLYELCGERRAPLNVRWARRFERDKYVGVEKKPLHGSEVAPFVLLLALVARTPPKVQH